MAENTIKPELPSGFRDYLPADARVRAVLLDRIREVFERFGFTPLATPAVERREILTGGDEAFGKQIFSVGVSEEQERQALRFDLTVPLARVVAAYPQEIKKPFRRYQIDRVWRGERAQAGRYREFLQCDADIVGTSNMMADADIIMLMYELMRSVTTLPFRIQVNNRRILNALAQYAGFDPLLTPAVLRSIDKLDKQEWDAVTQELIDQGLSTEQITKIRSFLALSDEDDADVFSRAAQELEGIPEGIQGITELRTVFQYLQAMGVPPDVVRPNLSIARGLGYYTGTVFETFLISMPELGSVCSGGRYDGLVERFSSMPIPAVGVSLGFDRLFAGLKAHDDLPPTPPVTQVLVLNFDEAAADAVAEVATQLRRVGIRTDLYVGQETSLTGQLSYAASQEIPVAVIIGADEAARGVAQVKTLATKTQQEVSLTEVAETVQSIDS